MYRVGNGKRNSRTFDIGFLPDSVAYNEIDGKDLNLFC